MMIGEGLPQLRKDRTMTQVQVAKMSGVAQNYISELESGVARNPSLEIMARLAGALGVADAELLAPLVRRPTILPACSTPPAARAPRNHQY